MGIRTEIQPGYVFNRLTAVKRVENNQRGDQMWLFKCDCGNECITRARFAVIQRTKSCGCLVKESVKIRWAKHRGTWATTGEKKCPRCKETKPNEEFGFNKNENRNSYCKPCFKSIQQDWVRDKIENDVAWVKRRNEQNKIHRESHHGSINTMLLKAKHRARKSNKINTLVYADIEKAMNEQNWTCLQTGIPFDLRKGEGRKPFGPSIDRIDSSRGYEPDNIQIVCTMYNLAKSEFDNDDVLKLAHALIEHKQKSMINRLKLRVVK